MHRRTSDARSTEATDAADARETADAVAVVVESLASDPEALAHAQRVSRLARAIVEELELDAAVADEAGHVALIASVGLRAVGADLLERSESLSARERERLCRAPIECAAMASRLEGSRALAGALRAQRERWDGSGYPDGLAGEQIPLAARIFAVADAWEALRSPRPHRPALSDAQAAEVLMRNSGRQFWPEATMALLALIAAPGPSGPPRPNPTPASTPMAPRSAAPSSTASPAWIAAVVVGLAVGLALALPLRDVRDRCPPPGEGLVQCQLQKSVLPAVSIVIICVVAALAIRWLLFDGVPRARDWMRRTPRDAPAPFDEDPVLVAANWGLRYEDAHPRRRVGRGRRWRREG